MVRMWEVEGSIRGPRSLLFCFLYGVPSIAERFGFIVVQCAEFVYIVECCFGYIVSLASAVGEYRLVPSAKYG